MIQRNVSSNNKSKQSGMNNNTSLLPTTNSSMKKNTSNLSQFRNRAQLFCARWTWKTNTIIILLLLNLYYTLLQDSPNTIAKVKTNLLRSKQKEEQPFNENDVISPNTNHLIIVAGHSVTISNHLSNARYDENAWYLLPYQKGQGLPQVIYEHIKAGIVEAAKDVNSLLIFSGGETRPSTGPTNEGTSYFHVADTLHMWKDFDDWYPGGQSVRARTTTEEFATDSFQNLLFSICRFKEITSTYPTKITMISFSFKRYRFEQLHRAALQYSDTNFNFIGLDPPSSTLFDLEKATQGEYTNAVVPFESDPYGCHSEILKLKRTERNPFKRTAPYVLTCPEIKELLEWCGPEYFPRDDLPWAN